MRLHHFATALSLVTIAHAWPWPPAFAEDAIKAVDDIFKRQDNNNNNNNNGGNASPASTNAANTASVTNSASGTASGSQTTGKATISVRPPSKSNGTTAYDPRDPAGGISMVTPNPQSGAQYYKIGDWVHLAWNYTSLQATPSAINIVATCSQNQATYTIAMNQSVNPTGEIFWDTGAYQASNSVPLLTNQYTLVIWDSSEAVTAAAKPGYLGSYGQFVFGMYTPQPYTPWSSYSCPTCSAGSHMEMMTWKFLGGMAGITVLTFTWFVTNLNVL